VKNVNAVVFVDVRDLRRPLVPWTAKQICSFTAEIRDVPEDISAVSVMVFKPNGEHFIGVPCSQDDNGVWHCVLNPAYFPAVGTGRYEVVGTDSFGNNAALGAGKIVIEQFTAGGTVVPTGVTPVVAEISDQYGIAHKIVAVNVGTAENPDWTSQVEV